MAIKISKINRSFDEASKNYTEMSNWYDYTEGIFESYFRNLGISLLDIKPSDHVLEIGFGTGSALTKIAKRLDTGKITGIDISDGMIHKTHQKIAGKTIEDNIELIHGNALTIEFDKYNKIFFSFSLELFELDQIHQLLSKCKNSLLPNGSIVIVSLYKPVKTSIGVTLYEYFHRLFPTEIDCRPIPTPLILDNMGFTITKNRILSMWGIPVSITKAKV